MQHKHQINLFQTINEVVAASAGGLSVKGREKEVAGIKGSNMGFKADNVQGTWQTRNADAQAERGKAIRNMASPPSDTAGSKAIAGLPPEFVKRMSSNKHNQLLMKSYQNDQHRSNIGNIPTRPSQNRFGGMNTSVLGNMHHRYSPYEDDPGPPHGPGIAPPQIPKPPPGPPYGPQGPDIEPPYGPKIVPYGYPELPHGSQRTPVPLPGCPHCTPPTDPKPDPKEPKEPDIDPKLPEIDPNENPMPFGPHWVDPDDITPYFTFPGGFPTRITNPFGIPEDPDKEKPIELPPGIFPPDDLPILTPRSPLDPSRWWKPEWGIPPWLIPGRLPFKLPVLP